MSVALFIGRFQPFHNGHMQTVKRILHENEKLIIAIGSAQENNTIKNPFTLDERKDFVYESLMDVGVKASQLEIIPIEDINDPPKWVDHLDSQLPKYDKVYTGSTLVKLCYNLKCPHKGQKGPEIISLKKILPINATRIRQLITANDSEWKTLVPKKVIELLDEFKGIERIKIINSMSDNE